MFSPLVARCAPRLPASGFQYVLPVMTSHPGAYAPGYDMPSFQDFPALEHKNRYCARDCDMPPFQDFPAHGGAHCASVTISLCLLTHCLFTTPKIRRCRQ